MEGGMGGWRGGTGEEGRVGEGREKEGGRDGVCVCVCVGGGGGGGREGR